MSVDYNRKDGFKRWYSDCGFQTQDEAIAALGCEERSYYRWKVEGLPRGIAGQLIHQKMVAIAKKRNKAI